MECTEECRATDDINDIRYSRQRYVLGEKALSKLAGSAVFLSGFGALGAEIAKNLILTGIQKLTIHDTKVATSSDLEVNFFLNKWVVGLEKRVNGSLEQLKELNPLAEIDVYSNLLEITSDFSFLRYYQCVVLTETVLNVQIMINEFCRNQSPPIKFISTDVFGVLGWSFCDFGNFHQVVDVDGEEPKEAFIAHITKSEPVTVTLLENQRHGLTFGDCVTLREVKGMEHLNGTIHKVAQTTQSSFEIEHIAGHGLSEYISGGLCKQVKIPTVVTFDSLSKQLHNPTFVEAMETSVETITSHVTFLTLHAFLKKHDRLPHSWCDEDVSEFIEVSKSIRANFSWQVNEVVMEKLALASAGTLPPLAAFLGGVIAQEVLKAVTFKFLPLKQMFYFNAANLVPDKSDIHRDSCDRISVKPLEACIGKRAVEALSSLNAFMIGCGAIGCEMLKNMAMLNAASSDGLISITDHDLVEKSNLTRQFLFRNDSIQKAKSIVAANSVHKFKPTMKIRSYQLKVGPETEDDEFSDAFFDKQHVVIGALDNLEGRRYLDKRCIRSCRPMLESGTMGTKGHVQVILPHLSESYSSQSDPVDDNIPYCTLKSFPSQIEHTVQWARDKFESMFFKKPDNVRNFFHARQAVMSILKKLDDGIALDDVHQEMLEKVNSTLQAVLDQKPCNWPECLAFARRKFEKYFNHKARQLLLKFPQDATLNDGSMFWQSPRRPPTPVMFDCLNKLHMDFILSTARLLALVWQIPVSDQDLSLIHVLDVLATVKIPDFVPNIKKYVETDHNIMPWMVQKDVPDSNYENTIKQLRSAVNQGAFSVVPQTFEKDDDVNGHIEFITSTSNLRAMMYGLDPADKHETRRIAGRIIPAIITTTAAVAALLTLELIRLVKGSPREKHQNCFLNLAISVFVFSEPAPAPVTCLRDDLKFTLWDKWEIRGRQDFTLRDFLKSVREKYKVDATMVLQGTKIVYIPFLPGHNRKLTQTMLELVTMPVREAQAELSVVVDAGDGNEKSGPPINYYFQ